MDFDSNWYWILLVIFGALCGIIGYYWGKGRGAVGPMADFLALKDRNAELQTELEACQKKLSLEAQEAVTSKKSDTKSAVADTTTAFSFNAAKAKAAFRKRVKQDDLKIVEGIGPKIENLFHKSGIKTWKALSEVSVAKCQEVLDSGGDRYRIHDPSSWPMQARMAYEGKWKVLVKWQDDHKAGKY